MPKLKELLDPIRKRGFDECGHLQLFHLLRDDIHQPETAYLLADEAFERGLLRVTEVSDSGAVPELSASNLAEIPVLLVDSEELIGAKQNRIVNTNVLLQPRRTTTIPVTCVEEGRWCRTREDFEPGSHTPPAIRAKQCSSVAKSLGESGVAFSNQVEAWKSVHDMILESGTHSYSNAMADVFDHRGEELNSYVKRLGRCIDGCGVAAFVSGRFCALDLFCNPATLQQFWPKLVKGYALEAIRPQVEVQTQATLADVHELLRRLGDIECVICPGVCMGDDWRFESNVYTGSALVFEGRALHMSAFQVD